MEELVAPDSMIFLGVVLIVFGLLTHSSGGGVAALIGLASLIVGALGDLTHSGHLQ